MASAASSCLASEIFENALNNFKANANLKPNELRDFEKTTIEGLQIAIDDIQTEFKRSRKQLACGRIQPCLDAMNHYSDLVEVFLNVHNFVAFIWGPIKFVLRAASQYADAFNLMMNGYRQIGLHLGVLMEYGRSSKMSDRMKRSLGQIFEDMLQFHRDAIAKFKGKTWILMFNALGPQLTKRFDHLNRLVELHLHVFSAEASVTQFLDIERLVSIAEEQHRHTIKENQRLMLDRAKTWLAGPSPDDHHLALLKKTHAGTGEWLFKDPRFRRWYEIHNCADPLLWLCGKPGAGKSILASTVIERIKSEIPQATTIFYYCRYNHLHRDGIVAVARALLYQLAIQDPFILEYIGKIDRSSELSRPDPAKIDRQCIFSEQDLSEINRSPELNKPELAKKIVKTALRSLQTTYIIIDGLDEFPREERKAISAWLQGLVNSLPAKDTGSIRCLFVSQDDGCARKDLAMLSQIKIGEDDNKNDIQSLCDHRQREIVSKFGYQPDDIPPSLQNLSIRVTARARGMFLFAELVTSNLRAQTTRTDLEREMKENVLPKEIKQAYERIVVRVLPSDDREGAIYRRKCRLLGWIACAKRPLKWYEIQGAMAIDTEESEVNEDGVLFKPGSRFVESCKDLCESLLEIDSDQSVAFVHFTAREYLIANQYIPYQDVDCELAMLCLDFFKMPELHISTPESLIEQSLRIGTYAFLDYATCFWALHLEAGLRILKDDERIGEVAESLDAFFDLHWAFSESEPNVSQIIQRALHSLKTHECYERTCVALAASKAQLRPRVKTTSDQDVLQTTNVLMRVRRQLESLAAPNALSQEEREEMKVLYGSGWFKCPRFDCRYFSEGFTEGGQRKQHISKHERAFLCTWTKDNCDKTVIGFTSQTDLDKHLREYHGVIQGVSDVTEYPPDDGPVAASVSKFVCNVCGKNFNKSFNMMAHMTVHTGEKPHVCDDEGCGKAFARKHDLARHQQTHKPLEGLCCKYELRDGTEKGCGLRFSKPDLLEKHLRSEAGQDCWRLFVLDGEASNEAGGDGAAAAEKAMKGQGLSKTSEYVGTFPLSILQRFPLLVGIRTAN